MDCLGDADAIWHEFRVVTVPPVLRSAEESSIGERLHRQHPNFALDELREDAFDKAFVARVSQIDGHLTGVEDVRLFKHALVGCGASMAGSLYGAPYRTPSPRPWRRTRHAGFDHPHPLDFLWRVPATSRDDRFSIGVGSLQDGAWRQRRHGRWFWS